MKLEELEIKLQIGSAEKFQVVYEACTRMLGAPLSHVRQLDEYYDTLDGRLQKQDLVIRIRTHGKKKTIALKSPRMELASGATSRIELEFLSGEKGVDRQLLDQGLHPHESAEKERWTFVYKECEIVLDKLPFIGAFMEIEGPSEKAIQEVIEMLELSSYRIVRKNYGELMLEKFRELKLPVDHISATFAKEAEWLAIE